MNENGGMRTAHRVAATTPPVRPLEDYIARAQIAWARRHAPWLLWRPA